MNAWIAALAGGVLLGLASGGLMLGVGRIAGVSGAFGGLLAPVRGDTLWRAAFVAGLVAAGALFALAGRAAPAAGQSWPVLVLAGLAVGAGATLANGCTSGHGICGLARLSARSLASVATFMATGFALTFVLRHLAGGY